eukprot:CAMPEP_0170175348 /NCGR_PEP_ID=MMETSP0040_2-20121228/8438_1 /TAXON_ID=641309 /ORGANISM="Lotharella oceanica, Strain CCMP622" /LENGTH=84 /DNA_ID=CAMNT_0010417297 /DNA_START=272 /DNA_END=523 /DNA_ORIENTATION=+
MCSESSYRRAVHAHGFTFWSAAWAMHPWKHLSILPTHDNAHIDIRGTRFKLRKGGVEDTVKVLRAGAEEAIYDLELVYLVTALV